MLRKKKILIIDDEKDFTIFLRENLLQTKKYTVNIVNVSTEALYATRLFKPNLILMDIMMPDLDGGKLAQQIENDFELKDIPILFLTAIATKEEMHRSDGITGKHPFISKAATMEELIHAIEENIG